MNAPRSTRRSQASTIGLALVSMVVVAASVALLRINSVTAAPPVASPSVAPATAKTPTPVAHADAAFRAGFGRPRQRVRPRRLDPHPRPGRRPRRCRVGEARRRMSVRWHDSIVENVDAASIRVTWVGLPGDDVADLGISGEAGAYVLTIVQPGPYANTDAMGEDRVLILTFDAPVSAETSRSRSSIAPSTDRAAEFAGSARTLPSGRTPMPSKPTAPTVGRRPEPPAWTNRRPGGRTQ